MPFMQAQVRHIAMFLVETSEGTECIPSDLVGDNPVHADFSDYVNGEVDVRVEVELFPGWYSRFSAPGYMDCTEWCGPHDTEEAALDALAETHDVCRSCFENCEDSQEGSCS